MINIFRIAVGEEFLIPVSFENSVLTDTVTITIRRDTDDYYYNFTTSEFQAASASGSMEFDFDTNWIKAFTPLTEDTYTIVVNNTTLSLKESLRLIAQGFAISEVSDTRSKLSIANMALTKIGAERITSFAQESEEARKISAVWNYILDELLAEHPWTFAQKRAQLALLDTTPAMTDDGLNYVFAKPSDFIKLNYTNSREVITKIENDGILCNLDELKIIYTARVDDPTKYSPQFITAFATRLASEICFAFNDSKGMAETLFKEYETIRLPRAIASDSQQDSPQKPIQDEWERARLTGSGMYETAGNLETWHPWI